MSRALEGVVLSSVSAGIGGIGMMILLTLFGPQHPGRVKH